MGLAQAPLVSVPHNHRQWKPGRQFQINNRIDVKDTMGKWMEAKVIEINEDKKTIKVHYKGYTARWDEELDFSSDRIGQIGLHSKAYGSGRKQRAGNIAQNSLNGDPEDAETQQKRIVRKEREDKFRTDLDEIGLRIFSMGADGNCLFRAFSHQVYGTEDHFKYIRKRTMDY